MDSSDKFEVEFTVVEYERIQRLARSRGTDVRNLIIDLVAAEIDRMEEVASADPGVRGSDASVSGQAFTDGIEHLIGSVDGPSDLSSNPWRMGGFGS